ncbi:MAG: FecR domain-containing protein [Anaerovoracaceae bacterium]
MKKIISLLTAVIMLFSLTTSLAFAGNNAQATSMKIAGTKGTVGITDNKGENIKAKNDMRLANGYKVATAQESYCYINLDDTKAVKMDSNTKVAVEKSGKKIELKVKSGQILFDVPKKLSGNESLNIKTSNMTTGVRGTRGIVYVHNAKEYSNLEILEGRVTIQETEIVLLNGSLEIKTKDTVTVLVAGEKATIVSRENEATGGDNTELVKIEKAKLEDIQGFGLKAVLEIEAVNQGAVQLEAAMNMTEPQLYERVNKEILIKNTILGKDLTEDELQKAAEENGSIVEEDIQEEKKALEDAEKILNEQIAENMKEMEQANKEIEESREKSDFEEVDQVFESAPAASGGGGSRGGSSGSNNNNSGNTSAISVTGYTGPYDGISHPLIASTNGLDGYIMFTQIGGESITKEEVQGYATSYESYKEEQESSGDAEILAFEDYISSESGERLMSSSNVLVSVVADTGTYTYFAVPETGEGDVLSGTFNVTISPIEAELSWTVADPKDPSKVEALSNKGKTDYLSVPEPTITNAVSDDDVATVTIIVMVGENKITAENINLPDNYILPDDYEFTWTVNEL